LIARRSSTAAVGAGTADIDDRAKGNGSRLVRCGRRSAACRAGQPSRSLRQAPRPAGPPPLFAPTTEKWNKTAIETACSRGNCTATTFGDVAARNNAKRDGPNRTECVWNTCELTSSPRKLHISHCAHRDLNPVRPVLSPTG
jgi:hypothetical protein